MSIIDKYGQNGMWEKDLLILERSKENLTKVSGKSKGTTLEGIFCVFGKENKNNRIYQEAEYLKHIEYLDPFIKEGRLLGELDHPDRFEVHLQDASHRITDLWYDSANRQLKGRIEILDTPKGRIAQSLIDSGVPLSISSRAAGRVLEDKTVRINQIYTYDLVANPGFADAVLHNVNESQQDPNLKGLISVIESFSKKMNALSLRDVSESIGLECGSSMNIIDVSEQYSSGNLPTGYQVVDKKDEKEDMNNKSKDIEKLSEEVSQLKQILSKNIEWCGQIAKTLNAITESVNESASAVKKLNSKVGVITEAVNNNATYLENMEGWTSHLAESVNVMGATIDHNANIVNSVTEWVSDNAKTTNHLNGWITSISENLNLSMNYAQDMFGMALSKEDGSNIINVVKSIKEGKQVEKNVIENLSESLSKHSFNGEVINESAFETLRTLDVPTSIPSIKEKDAPAPEFLTIDPKTGTYACKFGSTPFKKSNKVSGVKTLDCQEPSTASKSQAVEGISNKLAQPSTIPTEKETDKGSLPSDAGSIQNMADNFKEKPRKDLNKIKEKLSENYSATIARVEAKRALKKEMTEKYPFTVNFSEDTYQKFTSLAESERDAVAREFIRESIHNQFGDTDKIFENAVILSRINTESGDKWVLNAPGDYRILYENASPIEKERINQKASFLKLDSQSEINEFWKSSGLKNVSGMLNESLTANELSGKVETVNPEEDMKRQMARLAFGSFK